MLNKLFLSAVLICLSVGALAQETTNNSPTETYTFTNPACDFEVDLPEPFYEKQICQDNTGLQCTNKANFTKEIEGGALFVDLLCVPMPEGYYNFYNKETIAAFTSRMFEDKGIDPTNAEFSYLDDPETKIKNSTAIVQSQAGLYPALNIAQFWVSPNSMLSTEVKIINGLGNEKLNEMSGNIIQSTRTKTTYIPPKDSEELISPPVTLPQAE